ncbi:restriction endonuclease subunit S [Bombella mellum]|uniref:Type I restriction modification DNA specificity domain-containing protein n=1 Tax=Bombella mellum TaxID=2039288 RepID=A0ABR5ZRB6_9PROT|nr:restriction endonuclease subunit S [Bombella mellum]MBA5726773.1 hypothetical protein [Bombella mellum]
MSIFNIIRSGSLSEYYVLAPERYDPRRLQKITQDSVSLEELFSIENPTLSKRNIFDNEKYIVIDTGDSFEGIINNGKKEILGKDVGSSKKTVTYGDVIISRLRPYLRQIGFLDKSFFDGKKNILVSTEYFILKSRDSDINSSWIVPFLLLSEIQELLSRAQEGGHHPRFSKATLSEIKIPMNIVDDRKRLSFEVEKYIDRIQLSYKFLRNLTNNIENIMQI